MSFKRLVLECQQAMIPWCVDPKQWHGAVVDSHDMCVSIMPRLAAALNKTHHVSKSERFWHILIGPWLVQFVGVVIDRSNLLRQRPRTYGSFDGVVQSRIVPRTVYESIKIVETEEFGDQILQDIEQLLTHGRVDWLSLPTETKRDHLVFHTEVDFIGPQRLLRNCFNIFNRLTTPKNATIVSNSSIPYKLHKELRDSVPSLHSIVPVQDPASHYDLEPNLDARNNLTIGASDRGADLEHIIDKMIPFYLPICFLEGFERLAKISRKYPKSPKAILVGTEIYGRYESFCYWLANAAEDGTVVTSMQHGGTPGNEMASEFVFPEILAFDKFYSWGWRWPKYGLEIEKITPMPTMFLFGKSRDSAKVGVGILFVTTGIHNFVRRLCGSEGRPYSNGVYMALQKRFYESLSENDKVSLVVRLYPGDYGHNYKQNWQSFAPDLKFDSPNKQFDASLAECALYVTDHLSTTWLEALSKRKPTVIYLDFEQYDFTPETALWMDRLKRIGVVHRSPESAAHHINCLQNDFATWWWSEETQAELTAFLDVFAYQPEESIQLWAHELNSLVK